MRYWAASGRPGTDTAFDPGQMKVGRRLAMKLLNASRFALAQVDPRGPVTVPVDRAMLTSLARLVSDCTAQFDDCQYATVLERTERWFWSFCDDYLELVKSRRYGAQGPELAASANTALLASLSVLLRLFAPFLPFVTEEVWSWWQKGSVHRAPWPRATELLDLIGGADDGAALALERAALVLGEVRKTKSEAKRKLSTPVERLLVRDTGPHLTALGTAEADLLSSGFVEQLVTEEAETLQRGGPAARARAAAHRRRGVLMAVAALDPAAYEDLVRRALAEDVGAGDVTTQATVPAGVARRGRAAGEVPASSSPASTWRTRCSGRSPATPSSRFDRRAAEGEWVDPGTELASVDGPAAALLTAERTALNLLQRMCGIATAARRYVDAAGGRLTILDTRKTTPTMRAIEKYAVRVGGATNHRFGLYDQVLIKDNHVRLAGGIARAIAAARRNTPTLTVEIEAQTVAEAIEAADAGADIILLDNLTTPEIREAVVADRGACEDRNLRRRDAGAHSGAGDDRGRLRLGRRAHPFGPGRRYLVRDVGRCRA